MLRNIALLVLVPLLALPETASAVSAKDKMATCKVGADHEKLVGAKRKAFMAKCMSRGDAPAARPKPKPRPAPGPT